MYSSSASPRTKSTENEHKPRTVCALSTSNSVVLSYVTIACFLYMQCVYGSYIQRAAMMLLWCWFAHGESVVSQVLNWIVRALDRRNFEAAGTAIDARPVRLPVRKVRFCTTCFKTNHKYSAYSDLCFPCACWIIYTKKIVTNRYLLLTTGGGSLGILRVLVRYSAIQLLLNYNKL